MPLFDLMSPPASLEREPLSSDEKAAPHTDDASEDLFSSGISAEKTRAVRGMEMDPTESMPTLK